MHHFPKGHRNCSCATFWSTFLVQQLERFCCSWMPLHLTIRQWQEHNRIKSILEAIQKMNFWIFFKVVPNSYVKKDEEYDDMKSFTASNTTLGYYLKDAWRPILPLFITQKWPMKTRAKLAVLYFIPMKHTVSWEIQEVE